MTSGWPEATLGELANLERSSIRADDIEDGETYVGLENITNLGEFKGVRQVDAGELKSNKFRFDPSHILYGKLRPYLAKIAAPDFSGVCSTDILPVRPSAAVDHRYLLHYLRTPAMIEHASSQAVGANLPRLSPKSLEKFAIPLPPLEEQRRIAAILDAADALRTKRRQALAKFDTLSQAIFANMFGDPRMKSAALSQVCKITMGQAPKGDTYNDVGKGLPLIAGAGDFGDLYPAPRKFTTAQAVRKSEPGDVIVGIRASIGNKVLANGVYCLGRGVASLRSGPALDQRYLWDWMTQAAPQLAAKGRGSTFLQVNKADISKMAIPLPPMAEQRRFARLVGRVDQLRRPSTSALDQLDNLFAALQQRAFRGEL